MIQHLLDFYQNVRKIICATISKQFVVIKIGIKIFFKGFKHNIFSAFHFLLFYNFLYIYSNKVLLALLTIPLVQFSSVQFSHPIMSDSATPWTPGFPVHHQLPELAQTHVHQVSDAIQPSTSVVPFSSCLQSFPASGSYHPMTKVIIFTFIRETIF